MKVTIGTYGSDRRYGIRVGLQNVLDCFEGQPWINTSGDTVIKIILGGKSHSLKITPKFWPQNNGKCHEIRDQKPFELKKWLLKNNLGTWQSKHPPKLHLLHIDTNKFELLTM